MRTNIILLITWTFISSFQPVKSGYLDSEYYRLGQVIENVRDIQMTGITILAPRLEAFKDKSEKLSKETENELQESVKNFESNLEEFESSLEQECAEKIIENVSKASEYAENKLQECFKSGLQIESDLANEFDALVNTTSKHFSEIESKIKRCKGGTEAAEVLCLGQMGYEINYALPERMKNYEDEVLRNRNLVSEEERNVRLCIFEPLSNVKKIIEESIKQLDECKLVK